jgi:hypothetical protein
VFDEWFCDRTLRLDYVFAGDVQHQQLYVDQLVQMPRWYGRRTRLAELPLAGNGQITVRSHRSQQVIYRHSFSTLFQEWLATDEAKHTQRSFENVFLVPFPRDTVDITVQLFDFHNHVQATMTHTVSPSDVLISRQGERLVSPYVTLQQAADTTRCIHIAYIAEGYTEEEMPTFLDDVNIAVEAMFAHEPFRSLRSRFNIVAVKAPSRESGTSQPSKGIWRNTALKSHFDTFYSNRYLTTLHLKTLHDWLAGTPYEHIIVLVNTSEYGGGGILNSYNLSMAHHRMFRPVVVHEFGHSFAGLADEYAYEYEDIPMYPHDVEPWEPNITTLADFSKKWQRLLPANTVIPTPIEQPVSNKGKRRKAAMRQDAETATSRIGVYQGAGYSMKGVYRAFPDCRMRTNENPEFCPVCQKAIRDLVEFYTGEE